MANSVTTADLRMQLAIAVYSKQDNLNYSNFAAQFPLVND